MCGIAGYISANYQNELQTVVQKMQDSLYHRGPDGAGCWKAGDSKLMFAMRRLAIIDIDNGHQPFINENQDLILVANGEIYNFVELREELIQRGHRFTSNSDCEVILHLYEEKGIDCLHDLRGMFAFALLDVRQGVAYLVRDRMGEKPLYIFQDKEDILFASELKSLLKSGKIPLILDEKAIYWYFHYGYVPEPLSPIRNIRKLPAGSVLSININDWEVTEKKWWCIENAPAIEANPVLKIREVLDEISQLVVRSDVPVGIALSGGLDSSLIAALIARNNPSALTAFSVGYEGRPLCDERDDARLLAEHLNIPFHEVELNEEEMSANFLKLAGYRDDPIADIASWGYYQVMLAAKQKDISVMYQGQGADELFWGYPWLKDTAKENYLRLKKFNPSPENSDEIDTIYPYFMDKFPFFHDGGKMPYTSKFKNKIKELGTCADPRKPYKIRFPWKNVDIMTTKMICDTYLLENGIAQSDRLSMATSVELRLPLIDYRLVETVIGLRKTQSDIDLQPKAWLREAVRDLLPEKVLNRPKRGFSPPTHSWQKQLFKTWGHLLEDGLLTQHDILTPEGAKNLAKGEYPAHAIVPASFKALILETWLRAMKKELT